MIGSVVGNYKLVRQLGAGAMGEVYLGEHVVLKQLRAVKMLRREYATHPRIIERFVGEAKAVAALNHANVVAVDDIGQLETGVCYMVLEYLEGGTLAGFLASQGGAIAPHLVVHILAQAACGLQAAHDRGIIHRDLKPENVFLTDGTAMHVVLIDFGVARLAEALGGSVTKTGVVVGTPQYMAPEQHRGERVGPAADVYALGVMLYEMITGGWLPYLDEHARKHDYLELTASEIYHRQMTRSAFDPRRRLAGLRDPLVELVLATLDRDPERRPATPRAFALRLAQAVPTDGYHPDGLEIVRDVAKPLLDVDNLLETVRAPRPATTASSPSPPRYQLLNKLGAGGMAEVYAATITGAEGFQRQVAIKRVLSGLSAMPAFAEMFKQEARIMARLDHPNIVGVLAFDRDPEDRLFLVMEYVDGRDLSCLVETGRLPTSLTIFIVTEILQGLGYAHHFPDPTGEIHGVVHRDMSPNNVLLAWTGAVKVSDFGIAKAFAESGVARSMSVKGKPQYMSPEQVNAEPLDGRSDLFAVGIMLWELLTGEPLFVGTTRETMAQVMCRDIPRPSRVRPGIAADVEAVTMKLLDRDRASRYANAESAVEDLSRCADAPRNGRRELSRALAERFPDLARARSRQPSDTAGPRAHAPVSTLGSAASQSLAGPRGSRSSPRRWAGGAIAVAVVAGAGIGAAVFARTASDAEDARPILAIAPTIDAPQRVAPPDAQIIAQAIDAAVAQRDAAIAPSKPPPVRPIATGDLVIAVAPYAEVWLDGRPIGPTPIRTKVAIGAHRVVLVNTDLGIRKTLNVIVTTHNQALIEQTW